MRASRIILAIASIICGIICLCVPTCGISFIGWMLTIIMLASSISIIYGYVSAKTSGIKPEMYMGVGTLILGIILLVFSIIAMFNPDVRAVLDTFILVIFTIGLIFKGANMISIGIMVPGPGFLLIFPGILLLIAGGYGIVSIFYAAAMMDLFCGVGFIVLGISMLCGDYQYSR